LFVDDEEESATSFGSVAGDYDRVRPGPAPAAVDWLLPDGCAVAVDLAAGTGLFTRALEGRAGQVVAVEPDERMRHVLAARSPGVRVLDGRAEEIPLPDGCADAVLVSHAWHWFDPQRAVPEIARVLADGGRLGVLWTSRDRDEDWVAELDVIRSPKQPRTTDEAMERLSRQHTVTLPEGAPFAAAAAASFGFARMISVDDMLDWLATASQVITAEPAERAAGLARSRAALEARAFPAAGTDMVRVPMRSWCWRADRLPRVPLSGTRPARPAAWPYFTVMVPTRACWSVLPEESRTSPSMGYAPAEEAAVHM
jgi:ubiquinone/menaquinone biosynthesis C-methylase UbiE